MSMSRVHIFFLLLGVLSSNYRFLKLTTNSEIPAKCIKGAVVHTKTDGTVCRRDTDQVDETCGMV